MRLFLVAGTNTLGYAYTQVVYCLGHTRLVMPRLCNNLGQMISFIPGLHMPLGYTY
jgi:hypothetical protein